MKQYIDEKFALPISTGATEYGPKISYEGSITKVIIDHCDKELEIVFNGTFALRFIPDISCNEFHINAYSNISRVLNSEWIEELKLESSRENSFQEIYHFMVYFDHHGVLEIIGTDYVVGS